MSAPPVGADSLSAFFQPRSIAIIGASGDETRIGGRPIRNLRLGGYAGPVYPINPRHQQIQGLKAYPAIKAVGEPIDLAIIAVSAAQVIGEIEACAAGGVRAAIIFSSGFSEAGEEGDRVQAKIAAIAKRSGLRVLGPNCMGVINTRAGVIATFTSGIVDAAPSPGRIGLASQSGAFGSHCLALLKLRGLSVSLWATTGNQCDVEVADFLEYMVNDPSTDVIVASIEGVHDAARLVRALDQARRNRKPVIIMKVGRSDAGAAAMASHTASLAGSDAIFDAVVRQYGAYRARDIDELLDITYACSRGRMPTDTTLGLVSVSGGVGVLMADAATDFGLGLTPLPDAAQARLHALVPFASARNPLDVTAQILNDPGLIERMFQLMIEEGGYASIVLFLAHLGLNPAIVGQLLPGLRRVAERFPDRYLAVSVLSSPAVCAALEDAGYAVFEDPSRAVRSVHALSCFAKGFDQPCAPSAPRAPPQLHAGRRYSEHEAKAVLRAAGIAVSEEKLVASAGEAVVAAESIGYPVALKIVSADIPHKSEIGGVLLNQEDAAAVREGHALLVQRAAEKAPAARIDGVLVAQMVSGGVETVLGIVRDPIFGPVVMFGLGGVLVEFLKDVVFRLAPFDAHEAHAMVDEIRGRAILDGVRGAPPADVEALVKALVRLSDFAVANEETLISLDINPFIVRAEGEGAIAVDALIETRQLTPQAC